uniref:Uncharacterized protein n=1 Tax=viral metagenome TaxID=1070528 RepID=A0A6C0DEQ3_9ZZZZ
MSNTTKTPTNNAGKNAIKEWPTAAQPSAVAANAERRATQANFTGATLVQPTPAPGPAPGPQGGKRKRKTLRKTRRTLGNKNKSTRKH